MVNDFYIGMYEDMYGCLIHWGIDGMKWGIQNGPPYPLDRQTHNRVVKGKGQGKKKPKGIKGYIKAKKTAKKRKAALEKARKARAAKAAQAKKEKELEENKERVLRSGSATELMKYKGRLTNKELQDAWNRLELEGKILSKSEAENLKPDKVKEFFDKVDKYQKYAESGIRLWDTSADIINAFGNPNKPIPKIRGEKKKDKDKDDNDNKSMSKKEMEDLLRKYTRGNSDNSSGQTALQKYNQQQAKLRKKKR